MSITLPSRLFASSAAVLLMMIGSGCHRASGDPPFITDTDTGFETDTATDRDSGSEEVGLREDDGQDSGGNYSSTDPQDAGPSVDNTGGYTVSPATFDWHDISWTGAAHFLTDDQMIGPFPMGFTFPFFEDDWTEFSLSSNGFIALDAYDSAWNNLCPIETVAPSVETVVALMWDDLDPDQTAPIYHQLFYDCPAGAGQCLIVQYNEVQHVWAGKAGTFQGILFDSGAVIIQFLDAGDNQGTYSTTGLKSGDEGISLPCNTNGAIANGQAFCFTPPGVTGC